MIFPYLTLHDETEITHSEMKPDGRVKVYIETPDDHGGFCSATAAGTKIWITSSGKPFLPKIPLISPLSHRAEIG